MQWEAGRHPEARSPGAGSSITRAAPTWMTSTRTVLSARRLRCSPNMKHLLFLGPVLLVACTGSDTATYRSALTGADCTPDPTLAPLHADSDPADHDAAQTCAPGQPDPRACDPADTKKTTVCHIPPGNPSNEHTICVGNAAVVAHLAHGDVLGSCCAAPSTPPPDACDDQACCTTPPTDGGSGPLL